MTSESFQKGYLALAASFPGLQFNSDLFWATLSDLDGGYFLKAVMSIIKNTKELYPGSNMIAIVRGLTLEIQKQDIAHSTLKIEAETEKERIDRWRRESTPMPEDCRLALVKLGIKIEPKAELDEALGRT
jgi:hypothetical protein